MIKVKTFYSVKYNLPGWYEIKAKESTAMRKIGLVNLNQINEHRVESFTAPTEC